jgi:hypothetical protein
MAQIVNKCLLSGQGLFTCWPMIVYLLVKACLLVGQGLFTSWSRLDYFVKKQLTLCSIKGHVILGESLVEMI